MILTIDDEPAITESLAYALKAAGFTPLAAASLAEADAHLAERGGEIELIILDLSLPDGHGFDWLRRHPQLGGRAEGGKPVMILSSHDDEVEHIVGLELGADDYLDKPFSPREVVARVRAILRRAQPTERGVSSLEAQPLSALNTPERAQQKGASSLEVRSLGAKEGALSAQEGAQQKGAPSSPSSQKGAQEDAQQKGAPSSEAQPLGAQEGAPQQEGALSSKPQENAQKSAFSRLKVSRERYEARVDERLLPLSQLEFELLAYLVERPNKAHSRPELLRGVWGSEVFVSERTVDVHIKSLRKKLGDIGGDAESAALIETVRGVGYRLRGEPL